MVHKALSFFLSQCPPLLFLFSWQSIFSAVMNQPWPFLTTPAADATASAIIYRPLQLLHPISPLLRGTQTDGEGKSENIWEEEEGGSSSPPFLFFASVRLFPPIPKFS